MTETEKTKADPVLVEFDEHRIGFGLLSFRHLSLLHIFVVSEIFARPSGRSRFGVDM